MVTANSRKTWIVVLVAGVVGLAIGAVGGYFGYFLQLKVPLTTLVSNSNAQPFEQTYNEMARLTALEMSAANCNGSADVPKVIENEKRLIDLLESSATAAKLTPQLNVASAIVAYRSAVLAEAHSDNQAFNAAVEQERAFLQSAGWKDTSHDHLASVVRDLDRCSARNATAQEKK
jgi:hypothetical protein